MEVQITYAKLKAMGEVEIKIKQNKNTQPMW